MSLFLSPESTRPSGLRLSIMIIQVGHFVKCHGLASCSLTLTLPNFPIFDLHGTMGDDPPAPAVHGAISAGRGETMNGGYKAEQGVPEGKRGVGILATDEAGLEEMACLLARQAVAVSRAIVETGEWPVALQALQNEPGVEAIILARAGEAAPIEPLLDQVKHSNKPTVVCLLGSDPRLAWRAGAIPARRLDEAARRAAAWIRGWDQALISSQLQEEDEQMLARARDLWPIVGRQRGQAAHVLAPGSLGYEARLMIAEMAGPGVTVTCSTPEVRSPLPIWELAANPATAAILLTMGLGTETAADQVRNLARMVRQARADGVLVCVHLYGSEQRALARGAATMEQAGAIVADSNAAAARLVGLVLGHVTASEPPG